MFWFFLLSLSTWNQIVRFKKKWTTLVACVCVCDASLALVRTGWSRSLGPDILSCIFLAFAVFVLCHRPVSTGNKQKKKNKKSALLQVRCGMFDGALCVFQYISACSARKNLKEMKKKDSRVVCWPARQTSRAHESMIFCFRWECFPSVPISLAAWEKS